MQSNLTRISAGSQRWGGGAITYLEVHKGCLYVQHLARQGFYLYRDQQERFEQSTHHCPFYRIPTSSTSSSSVYVFFQVGAQGLLPSCYDAGGIRLPSSHSTTQADPSSKSCRINITQPRTPYLLSLTFQQPLACSTISEPRYSSLCCIELPACATYSP
jgi:hypothetical protein